MGRQLYIFEYKQYIYISNIQFSMYTYIHIYLNTYLRKLRLRVEGLDTLTSSYLIKYMSMRLRFHLKNGQFFITILDNTFNEPNIIYSHRNHVDNTISKNTKLFSQWNFYLATLIF